MNKSIIASVMCLGLAACGGGSSSSDGPTTGPGPTPPLPDNSPAGQEITANAAEVTSLALLVDGDVTDIQWTQTSGTEIALLSASSKVIGFEVPEAGNYEFSLTYKLNGNSESETRTVTASSTTQDFNVRVDHAVLAENNVSMRTTLASGRDLTSLNWEQIEGPSVSLEVQSTPGVAFFDAPNVSQDALLGFNVTAVDSAGTSHEDKIWILVEQAPALNSNALFEDRVATVYAYNADSPFKDSLESCIYNNVVVDSCTLRDMPLIAHTSTNPTTDTIMDRVLVSHDWMGDRFKQYLESYDTDQDFKRLLRATTAIVISYDIRPSFYQPGNGAIYLDPENLWLTPEERDTINEAPDYRADFGNDLQFVMPWRYTKNNEYAYFSYDRDDRIPRTLDDINYRFASLLYHELAHANDFFSADDWASANRNDGFWDAVWPRENTWPSSELKVLYPLASQQMFGLAQVSFRGETADATQKAYTPSDIRSFFVPDGANDFYNYSSQYEDLAMNFEELMMYHRYGVRRDVAITTPFTDDGINNDYIVNWGQRGRTAELGLESRVKYTVTRVLPEVNVNDAYSSLPAPTPMMPGLDWWDNLEIESRVGPLQERSAAQYRTEEKEVRRPAIELRRHH